jgi:hypothetical protein
MGQHGTREYDSVQNGLYAGYSTQKRPRSTKVVLYKPDQQPNECRIPTPTLYRISILKKLRGLSMT